MSEPQRADEVRYPCTFPETNHEALMDNLYAVVEQRNEARAEVERLRKMVVEHVKYGWNKAMFDYVAALTDGDV